MDGHMRTLIRLTYIFVLSLTLSPLGSNAGVGTSGGGHVIVCDGRRADTLGYVTLLDIYEAEHVFKMSLRIPQTSLQDELNILASQLQIVLGASARIPSPLNGETLLEWWENRAQFIPTMSAHTGDYGVMPALPTGCGVKQIAIYDDANDIIQVSLDLWESLDDFNKAALIAHELIYHDRRLSDREVSSETSRYLVGRVFSTQILADSKTLLREFKATHAGSLNPHEANP